MKFKYIGEQDEITFRGVTFKKGKPVDLSDNPSLTAKVGALDYFAPAKAKKAAKNG